MNPPRNRPPSRFVRGRARGGGAYRPYFYFRRGGRVIPAGGANQGEGGAEETNSNARGRKKARGGRKCLPWQNNSISNPNSILNSSFLRPEHYAAPADALQVQSFAVDAPLQCPGWRLYFTNDNYQQNSEQSKRIKLLEHHFNENLLHYDMTTIQQECFFLLQAKVLLKDTLVTQGWPTLLQDLRTQPQQTLALMALAMHSLMTAAAIDASVSEEPCTRYIYISPKTRPRKVYVRPVGFQNVQLISQLTDATVDSMICVRGAVASVGNVEAAIGWICYKCSRCYHEQVLRQTGSHTSRPYCCKREGCAEKKGFVEQRSSPYTRIIPKQIIRLAEVQLQALVDFNEEFPDYLDVELRHDLVDTICCGEQVIVTGILKRRPLVEKENSIDLYLKAFSIEPASKVPYYFSERDMQAISAINSEPDSFKLLVQSLAPELHGQEMAKAGVLLSLFGGSGSQLHDEEELNVLLVGDPGIGKSHVLQMCAKISGKGYLYNSKSSSGAGNSLSPSLPSRSNHTLDAGAIISSLHGHCAIDDIDRMASQQETLLQVLQSQTITLPFANLFATLQAPTSILATANPLRGHYDQSKLLKENIRLLPSLLNHFHLIFLLLDKPDKDMDTSLTEHIKALHAGSKKSGAIAARFDMKPKMNNSTFMNTSETDENDEDYDLGKRLKLNVLEDDDEMDLLPPVLIKKFIAYTRHQLKPLLNKEAAEAIKEFYFDLRKQDGNEMFGATNTSRLDALIRLSQARARVDLSSEVTKAHVRDVLCIVRHSMADTAVGDYVDINPAGAVAVASGSQSGNVRKLVQMLQLRSNALGRRVFDYDELKDMATRLGIGCGVSKLVDVINMQGFLLKKGPDLYEVMAD